MVQALNTLLMIFPDFDVFFLTGLISLLLPTRYDSYVARICSGIPPMNSEAHWVCGESYNCQETHIEFNKKEIKGVVSKY
jgi:hypothetical protein